MKKKVQLEGMKCSNCVEHVKKVLGDLNRHNRYSS